MLFEERIQTMRTYKKGDNLMHYVAVVESYEDSAPPLILAPSKIWY